MTKAVQVPGKAEVKIDDVSFCITRNGIAYSKRTFFSDVFSDTHGGDAGPPIDRQLLGFIADIRIIAVEWEKSVLDKIFSCMKTGTAGRMDPEDIGKLLIAGSEYIKLNWVCATDTSFNRTFERCLPSAEPKEMPIGTKNSELVLAFEGWRNVATNYIWQA